MSVTADLLPAWLTWQQRPFPDANLLLVHGQQPALVDSGFVGYVDNTALWARANGGDIGLVVNTHWHSDHVGGSALLQAGGAGIAASVPDAAAIERRDPGLLPRRVPRSARRPIHRRRSTPRRPDPAARRHRLASRPHPGHTGPGHLSLWQPDERILAVGDALSDYDVGGSTSPSTAPPPQSPRSNPYSGSSTSTPAPSSRPHGPLPGDIGAALATATRRAQRLVDDPDGAVGYGAGRILAFALIIRNGIPAIDIDTNLLDRTWLHDAARLLSTPPDVLANELVTTMLGSGAIVQRNGRLHAAAEHTPVDQATLRVPFPKAWSATTASRRSHNHPRGSAERADRYRPIMARSIWSGTISFGHIEHFRHPAVW